jgi:hypothetical protein
MTANFEMCLCGILASRFQFSWQNEGEINLGVGGTKEEEKTNPLWSPSLPDKLVLLPDKLVLLVWLLRSFTKINYTTQVR